MGARLLIAGSLLLAWCGEASACAVCFGDPESDLARGAVRGVIFMVGVITMVLAGIGFVAISWSRKARRLAEAGETL